MRMMVLTEDSINTFMLKVHDNQMSIIEPHLTGAEKQRSISNGQSGKRRLKRKKGGFCQW